MDAAGGYLLLFLALACRTWAGSVYRLGALSGAGVGPFLGQYL